MFLKYSITPTLIKHAEELSLKKTLNKSIMNGERNVLGTLGEVCYLQLLGFIYDLDDIIYEPTTNFDVQLAGVKIDVKSKQRTVEPLQDYEASIVAYSRYQQHCDAYAFTSITVGKHQKDFLTFYFLGFISKEDYFKKANFLRKGQIDGSNGYKVKEDCYNLPYSQLHQFPIDELDLAIQKGFEII